MTPSSSFAKIQQVPFEMKLYSAVENPTPVHDLPVNKKTSVIFKVFDNMRGEFDPADKIEIWRVDGAGKQQEKLGMAITPMPRITTGESIPRILITSLIRDKPGAEHYQAFTIHKYGERMTLPRVTVSFSESPVADPEFERELNACMKKKRDLADQIPKKSLTGDECTQANGHIETPSMFCPEDPEDTSSEDVCKSGMPLGSVSGMQCPCICCK